MLFKKSFFTHFQTFTLTFFHHSMNIFSPHHLKTQIIIIFSIPLIQLQSNTYTKKVYYMHHNNSYHRPLQNKPTYPFIFLAATSLNGATSQTLSNFVIQPSSSFQIILQQTLTLLIFPTKHKLC